MVMGCHFSSVGPPILGRGCSALASCTNPLNFEERAGEGMSHSLIAGFRRFACGGKLRLPEVLVQTIACS